MTKKTPTRNYALDIFRIIACAAVVTCHASGGIIDRYHLLPGTSDFMQCILISCLHRWDISFFLMLTGFFMLNPQKQTTIRGLFSNNILRMFLSLVFWGLFYGLMFGRPLYPVGAPQEGHLWYLGMILGVYLALPILRAIAGNSSLLKYTLTIWGAAVLYRFLGCFVTLPIDFFDTIFVDYACCVLLGYYLRTIFENRTGTARIKWAARAVYAAGIAGLILTIGMSMALQNDTNAFHNFFAPNVLATAAAALVFCLRHPITLKGKAAALVENCSKCTFGIYLMHVFFLAHICTRVYRFVPQPVLMTAISVCAAFVASYAATLLLRKIPFFNKYFI